MRLGHYILDADNNVVEVSLMEWAEWFENISNRRIGYTEITSQIHVSTMFMGIDHRFVKKGPPLLFETMIFNGPPEIDQWQWRYASYDDAITGHKTAVRKARQAIGQRVTEDC